jgi:hypothetical protein
MIIFLSNVTIKCTCAFSWYIKWYYWCIILGVNNSKIVNNPMQNLVSVCVLLFAIFVTRFVFIVKYYFYYILYLLYIICLICIIFAIRDAGCFHYHVFLRVLIIHIFNYICADKFSLETWMEKTSVGGIGWKVIQKGRQWRRTWYRGLDSCGVEQKPVACFYRNDTQQSFFIKGGRLLQ